MRALPLLLTVAIVLAALVAYDLFRGRDVPVPLSSGPGPAALAPGATSDAGGSSPRLGGAAPAILARLAALEHRVDGLEAAWRAGAERGDRTKDPGDDPRIDGGDGARALAADPLDPTVIEWFRTVKEAVERQDQAALKRAQATALVTAQGVVLTPEQREKVVDLTLAFRDQVDEALHRASREGQSTPEQRREILRRIRAEYGDALGRVLPAADADALLERLGPVPGYPKPSPPPR